MVTYNSRNDGIAYHFLIDCKKKKNAKCKIQGNMRAAKWKIGILSHDAICLQTPYNRHNEVYILTLKGKACVESGREK